MIQPGNIKITKRRDEDGLVLFRAEVIVSAEVRVALSAFPHGGMKAAAEEALRKRIFQYVYGAAIEPLVRVENAIRYMDRYGSQIGEEARARICSLIHQMEGKEIDAMSPKEEEGS